MGDDRGIKASRHRGIEASRHRGMSVPIIGGGSVSRSGFSRRLWGWRGRSTMYSRVKNPGLLGLLISSGLVVWAHHLCQREPCGGMLHLATDGTALRSPRFWGVQFVRPHQYRRPMDNESCHAEQHARLSISMGAPMKQWRGI
jgi:hypothetical protein